MSPEQALENVRHTLALRDSWWDGFLTAVVFIGVGLLVIGSLAGCSSDGALFRYTNDNGARGPEAIQVLPWSGAPKGCAAPAPK